MPHIRNQAIRLRPAARRPAPAAMGKGAGAGGADAWWRCGRGAHVTAHMGDVRVPTVVQRRLLLPRGLGGVHFDHRDRRARRHLGKVGAGSCSCDHMCAAGGAGGEAVWAEFGSGLPSDGLQRHVIQHALARAGVAGDPRSGVVPNIKTWLA
jgi:hypothetical protein